MKYTNSKNRYTGLMLGLAIGDALSALVEFMRRDIFTPVSDYQRGGKFNVAIGEYTETLAFGDNDNSFPTPLQYTIYSRLCLAMMY